MEIFTAPTQLFQDEAMYPDSSSFEDIFDRMPKNLGVTIATPLLGRVIYTSGWHSMYEAMDQI